MDSYYILYFNQIYFVSWSKKTCLHCMWCPSADSFSVTIYQLNIINNVVNFSILLTLDSWLHIYYDHSTCLRAVAEPRISSKSAKSREIR